MSHQDFCMRNLEFRAAAETDGDGRTLRGYAAVFDQETEIDSWEGRFVETFGRGAFRKTLRERKGRIAMQYDHGRDQRVGSVPVGVYTRLEEDDNGLGVEGRLFENDLVEPIRQAIEAQAINGMSVKFRVVRDEWHDNAGKRIKPDDLFHLLYDAGDRGPLRRTIKEVQLFECGPVSSPAYEQTTVGVRASFSEEDRMALVEQYRRSILEDEQLQAERWIEAEAEYNARCEEWLEAERTYDWLEAERTYQWLWLEAEYEYKAKDTKKPYGDVTYADPGYQKDGKKRYPLDTKEHVKAAWSYINMPKNAAKYSSAHLSSIKGKIKSAAKKFGIDISDEKKSASTDAALRGTSGQSGKPDHDAVRKDTSEEREHTNKSADGKARKAMNINELRAREQALLADLSALGDEFRDTEMPEDKEAEYTSAKDELDDVRSKIKVIEDRAEEMKQFAVSNPSSREKGTDRGPAFHSKERNIYDLDATRMEATSPEDYVSRVKEDAVRAIEKAHYSRSVKRDAAQERAMDLLEIDDEAGTLAKRILITGSPVYERAFSKMLRAGNTYGLTMEEQRAMSLGGGAGAEGGYAVPFQLDPTVILTSTGTVGDIRSVARVETIVGKEWQGITSAGITVSRDAESEEVSDDSFTLGQPTVAATKVQGFVPFTIEIETDWGALGGEITRMLADAKTREEAASFAIGVGTGVNPQGFVVGATTVSAGAGTATGDGLKGKMPGVLYALEEALDARWRANATFIGNKTVYNLVRQVDTAGGANLWERIGAGTPSQLLGYSALENSNMAGVYTNGSKVLAFGDFQQFIIVDRVGMSVELVPHLVGTNHRPIGQRGVYAYWRNSSKVLVPNAIKVLVTAT